MDNDRLQSCRSLGMGRRRLAKGTWCTRLRWRKRRSHHFRSCWSCISYFPWKTKNINGSSPHHLPFTMLGAGLLWFGWFGFNVGSALSLNDVALTAFINTNIGCWRLSINLDAFRVVLPIKTDCDGVACGAVSGLVAITPACGFVTPFSALLIGAIGGILCFGAVFLLKTKFGYDDTLDAFGCHGIGGTWGGIATGLFATTAVNGDGANGLFYGNASAC